MPTLNQRYPLVYDRERHHSPSTRPDAGSPSQLVKGFVRQSRTNQWMRSARVTNLAGQGRVGHSTSNTV